MPTRRPRNDGRQHRGPVVARLGQRCSVPAASATQCFAAGRHSGCPYLRAQRGRALRKRRPGRPLRLALRDLANMQSRLGQHGFPRSDAPTGCEHPAKDDLPVYARPGSLRRSTLSLVHTTIARVATDNRVALPTSSDHAAAPPNSAKSQRNIALRANAA